VAARSALAVRGRSWWTRTATACAVVGWIALLSLPVAFGGGTSNTGLGGGGGGDEGIGSLPSMVGGPGMLEPGGAIGGGALSTGLVQVDGGAPNLWLEGPSKELLGAIQGAWGNGYVTVQTNRKLGRTTLYFHGNVKLALSAGSVQSGQVAAGVWLSPAFQGSLASIEWNGNWTSPVAIGGTVNLPLAAAAHAGLFQKSSVVLHLATLQQHSPHAGQHASLGVSSQRGMFVLEQKTK
jgi:hypothetical protein